MQTVRPSRLLAFSFAASFDTSSGDPLLSSDLGVALADVLEAVSVALSSVRDVCVADASVVD